jgi:predicted porin
MKKSLLALAVGAAFAAPAAFADVTISGAINMGIEYLNVGDSDNNARNGVSNFGVASNYSNVTISSVDDLGGGLKLDFAYQITAPTNSAGSVNGQVNNRNSHIGLVGESWGGVWYGTNENIYERYFYTIDPLDGAAGLGGNLQMLGTPGGAVFSTSDKGAHGYTWYRRDSQTIWYDSPNFGGFTFGAAWETNYDKSDAPNANLDPQMFQLGAKYVGTGLPLQLWAAYGHRSDELGVIGAAAANGAPAPAGINGSTDQAFQFGGAYTLGDINIFAIFENLKYKGDGVVLGTKEWKRSAYAVGLKWNLASGYVGAQYIQALSGDCTSVGVACNDSDTGAHMIGVGYYHNMSKQTQGYIVGSWVDNEKNANYGTAGIGNSASFQNIGATYWGIGVGLKHTF